VYNCTFHKLPSDSCSSNPFRGFITNYRDDITHILFTHSYVDASFATVCCPDPSSHLQAPGRGHKRLLPQGATVAKVQVLTDNSDGEAYGIRMFDSKDELLLEWGAESFDRAEMKPDEWTVSTQTLKEREVICGLQAYLWEGRRGESLVFRGLQFVIRCKARQED
jgi:hypothetical protein